MPLLTDPLQLLIKRANVLQDVAYAKVFLWLVQLPQPKLRLMPTNVSNVLNQQIPFKKSHRPIILEHVYLNLLDVSMPLLIKTQQLLIQHANVQMDAKYVKVLLWLVQLL